MTVHPSTLDPRMLLAECQSATTRRSGPGGQHRNKVETAVVLTHGPTGISAEANEQRSQQANRQRAFTRLRMRLAVEIRTPAGPTSDLWRSRNSGGRLAINPDHADFPALVAEALNHLAACEFQPQEAAAGLEISASQLVKLLKKSPAAFTKLNDERRTQGLKPLQ